MVLQTDTRAPKKKVSRGNITDGINPSAISTVRTDGLTNVYSVGNYGMAGNCLATLCEIPTDSIRRQNPSVFNHRQIDFVGNYSMAGNCLATLCEISTDIIRRYVFKIYIKNNLLIVKNLNKQIKMD